VDIAGWLRELGLEEYEPAFRENHIEGNLLQSLTAEDLRDLGIASVGHRRRLLEAIKALPADAAPTSPAPRVETGAERRQLTVMFCDLATNPTSTTCRCRRLRRVCTANWAT
jgi:SAM domain (Sterile alpha motif)